MVRFVNGLWRFSYQPCDCFDCLAGSFGDCQKRDPMYIELDYRSTKSQKKRADKNCTEPTGETNAENDTNMELPIDDLNQDEVSQMLMDDAETQNSATLFPPTQTDTQLSETEPNSTQHSNSLFPASMSNPLSNDDEDESPFVDTYFANSFGS